MAPGPGEASLSFYKSALPNKICFLFYTMAIQTQAMLQNTHRGSTRPACDLHCKKTRLNFRSLLLRGRWNKLRSKLKHEIRLSQLFYIAACQQQKRSCFAYVLEKRASSLYPRAEYSEKAYGVHIACLYRLPFGICFHALDKREVPLALFYLWSTLASDGI